MYRAEGSFASGEVQAAPVAEKVKDIHSYQEASKEQLDAFFGNADMNAVLNATAEARFNYNTSKGGNQKIIAKADEAFYSQLLNQTQALSTSELGPLVKAMRSRVREHMGAKSPGESTLQIERDEAEASALSTFERVWRNRLVH